MMPVTGPAPIAKENIYLKLYKGKMNNPFTGNIKYWKVETISEHLHGIINDHVNNEGTRNDGNTFFSTHSLVLGQK